MNDIFSIFVNNKAVFDKHNIEYNSLCKNFKYKEQSLLSSFVYRSRAAYYATVVVIPPRNPHSGVGNYTVSHLTL